MPLQLAVIMLYNFGQEDISSSCWGDSGQWGKEILKKWPTASVSALSHAPLLSSCMELRYETKSESPYLKLRRHIRGCHSDIE